jgi:hypothetical protein
MDCCRHTRHRQRRLKPGPIRNEYRVLSKYTFPICALNDTRESYPVK